jgi:hypothetical protein
LWLSLDAPDPDCATGGRAEYPIALTADRLLACRYGKPQYTRVTYAFPSGGPYPPGSPGAQDPTVRFRCPRRPHADPRIRAMRMRLTGHNPGAGYYVVTRIRLRVCAVRGPAEVVMHESIRLGGEPFAEHTRTLKFRQRSRCQWHSFRWRLRDEFFGVGTYRVAASVHDKDLQVSRTVSRQNTTLD